MSVINEVVHPQAVFVNFGEDDTRLRAMASMVEGSLLLPEGDDLGPRRKLDWDIWVQRGGQVSAAPDHMHVLAMGTTSMGLIQTDRGRSTLFYGSTNHSPTMRIPPGLPEDIERLVRNELVPWASELESRPILKRSIPKSGGWGPSDTPIRGTKPDLSLVPFLLDADGHVIAGAFKREAGSSSWIWVIPHECAHPEVWLSVAMRDWHERTPHRVPRRTVWYAREAWMTGAESLAEQKLDLLERRRQRWEGLHARRREALEAELTHARTDATRGIRRLLTSNDDDLVQAVAEMLAGLGYEVTDEDQRRLESGQGKAHDLNVRDPDAPDRDVIVEVKGFGKGARGALAQGNQHILRFAVANGGRTPDACWLVLNHFKDRDPDERPALLQGADEDIAIFASNGGVLIDTRDLFRLGRCVDDGLLSRADARRLLRRASGRFALQDGDYDPRDPMA